MKIRQFIPSDANQIAQLFHDTIRQVNRRDYSSEQVRAWAPDEIHFRDWVKECTTKYTVVAEENGPILGFAELEDDGHIDCFYCHKDFQGQGVGKALFRMLEEQAKIAGCPRLSVEASITAKPFFLKMGFAVLRKRRVVTRGKEFINYLMVKNLG